MSGKPPDFEPLASGDPVPGDPDYIGQLGCRYEDTAYEIQRQSGNLRRLAGSTSEGWKGAAGTVFASKATDLATRISQAHDRYATAAQALTRFAPKMADAQQRAYAAVWKAKAAQEQQQANAPDLASSSNDGGLARRRAGLYDEAGQDLAIAQSQFDDAVEDYNNAASAAAGQITAELGSDPMTDSWWDANFGWISHLFEYIAIAVIVLAIVALILAVPLTAGLLAAWFSAGLVEGLSVFTGALLTSLLVGQTVFDFTAMVTDKESWVAFGMDVVALASFGTGKAAEAASGWLAENCAEIAKTVAARRAGEAVVESKSLPGFLFSLAEHSGLATSVMRFAGMGPALDVASKAAEEAEASLGAALKAVQPENITALFTMDLDVSANVTRLAVLDEKVPGVLRIEVARSFARALAGVDGAVQWTTFGGSGYFTLHSLGAGG